MSFLFVEVKTSKIVNFKKSIVLPAAAASICRLRLLRAHRAVAMTPVKLLTPAASFSGISMNIVTNFLLGSQILPQFNQLMHLSMHWTALYLLNL